jgi:superfamily I DNA/RNA helicase
MKTFQNYLNEAALRFGKHGGKDITQTPTGYLVWVMQNVGVGKNLSADERTEIEEYLASKNIEWRNFKLGGGQVQQQPQRPQPPTGRLDISDLPGGGGENDPEIPGRPVQNVQPQQVWIYAKAVKDCRYFSQGQQLALKGPLSNGSWAFRLLDADPTNAKAGVITKDEAAAGLIAAYRDANVPLKSTNPANPTLEDLKNQLRKIGQEPQEPEPEKEQPQEPAAQESNNGRPSPQSCRLHPQHINQYVEKIQNKFNQTKENFMIDALAGTGKTTNLKHLASFIKPGEKWLYLVFNKKNQVESVAEFPAGVSVMTTHAFLGQVLAKNGKSVGGNTMLPPMGAKWTRINRVLDKMVDLTWPNGPNSKLNFTNKNGDRQSPFNYKAKNITIKLASLAKNTAHDPNDPNIKKQLKNLIDKNAIDTDISTEKTMQDRDYTPDIIEKAIELMKTTMVGALPKNLNLGEIAEMRDQDDTLWYAALNADHIRWDVPVKYNVVLMDEVQDFNRCQLIMAKKLKEAGARVIGVGDPNQAMYLFRGSDAEAFHDLKKIIGGEQPGESLSLPINFRSDGNLIDWVNKNTHVNNLQYPDAKKGKGEVYAAGGTHPPIGYRTFMDQIQKEWQAAGDTKKLKQETCMICRTNAPLAHAALQLLKSGVNFEIVGKDLSKNLTDYIKKVTWNKPQGTDIDDLPSKLGDFYTEADRKWGHKIAKKDELKEMEEYTETLNSVLEYLSEKDYKETPESRPMQTAKDFMDWIEVKMGGKNPDSIEDMKALKAKDPLSFVTLTTAHKCKGLQWGRVFLMKPKAYDPENPKNKTEEQKQQERNCWYVAGTRGKNSLYVSMDDEP